MKKLPILTFLTCGSVDDGKSTFLGHLLFDTNALAKNVIQESNASEGKIDYSKFVDGLLSENEQSITIDVAYKAFKTKARRFLAIDSPGHEQYTKNMAVAASQANVALVLVDATKSILEQTKRHLYLCSLFQIKHTAILINKMDLVDYNEALFSQIKEEVLSYCQDLTFEFLTFIPISALNGDNITKNSKQLNWYHGPPVLSFLENVSLKEDDSDLDFLMSVQMVRVHQQKRYLYGRIYQGHLDLKATIQVNPSGEKAVVSQINKGFEVLNLAQKHQNICITLDRQLDVSKGDLLSLPHSSLSHSHLLRVNLFWIDNKNLVPGRHLEFKFFYKYVKGTILKIKSVIDIDTKKEVSQNTISRNTFCIADLELFQEVYFEPYAKHRDLGSFLIIDITSKDTVGVGTINYGLRRSDNLFPEGSYIDKTKRSLIKNQTPKVIWLTGLPGSGKTTIANHLEALLHQHHKHTTLLDGDNIRVGLCKDLGFEETDRTENIRRISEVAKLMNDAGLITICSFISPYAQDRLMAKSIIGLEHFIEVFIDTPLKECIARDPKGLYKKALQGEIPNFTGVGSNFEPPQNPDITIDTMSTDAHKAAIVIYNFLT